MTASDVLGGPAARRHAVTLAGAPSGTPLVLAHGFGTSQEMWRRVLPALSAERPVVLMDHVGSGASDLTAHDPRRHASLRGYAEDVVTLLDELDLGPVQYAGHSAGGIIGALACVARPDLFDSLAMIGSSPCYLDETDYHGGFTRAAVDELLVAMQSNYLGWSRNLAPLAMGNPDRPELTEELAASFSRNHAWLAVEFARAIFLADFRDEMPRVGRPTLVVQTSSDPMVPEAVGHHLHEAIPDSTLVLLEATGHFPHMSGPQETSRILNGFFAGRLVG